MLVETSEDVALQDRNPILSAERGVVASGEALSQQSLTLAARLFLLRLVVTGFGNAWSVGGKQWQQPIRYLFSHALKVSDK